MPLYSDIYGYFTRAKERAATKAKACWNSYYAQATWQGIIAPIYSYSSIKTIWEASDDVKAAVRRAYVLNRTYALEALAFYFIYYRLVHPALDGLSEGYNDYDSWNANLIQGGIASADLMLFSGMQIYLFREMLRNIVQNFTFTSTITYATTKVMPSSENFKACECSKAQKMRAEGDSLIFYAGNRFIFNSISSSIMRYYPGMCGVAASFALESASFGWPLVEYKLSAVGRCTEHRIKELLTNNKMYCFMFGASFVAATWSTSTLLTTISGARNDFIYDAVFSLMFQLYSFVAIARQDALPGNKHKGLDLLAPLKRLIQTETVRNILQCFLAELISFEALVQTPGVSLWLNVRDTEIKDSLNSIKGGLNTINNVQSNRLFALAKWLIIPEEITGIMQYVGKDYLSSTIKSIEDLLEKAREAEEERHATENVLALHVAKNVLALNRNDHFTIPDDKLDEDYVDVQWRERGDKEMKYVDSYYAEYYQALLAEEAKKSEINAKELLQSAVDEKPATAELKIEITEAVLKPAVINAKEEKPAAKPVADIIKMKEPDSGDEAMTHLSPEKNMVDDKYFARIQTTKVKEDEGWLRVDRSPTDYHANLFRLQPKIKSLAQETALIVSNSAYRKRTFAR